ncbi:MAG TPA: DUF2516 family protein [Marmoricola sp.]|jgi:hypothetical protein|nr:DUF2516 family protein [Marmoricola sp.]
MGVFEFQMGVTFVVWVVLLVVKAFVFVDALSRRPDAYPAADKLTKAAWLWITGLSVVAEIVLPGPLGLVSIIGTVASFVYLLDVRPALVAVTRR